MIYIHRRSAVRMTPKIIVGQDCFARQVMALTWLWRTLILTFAKERS